MGEPQFHFSIDALSTRSFQAVRNRVGPLADSLEGIASLGRERVSAINGVGVMVMTELDEALAKRNIDWGRPSPEGHFGAHARPSSEPAPSTQYTTAHAREEHLLTTIRSMVEDARNGNDEDVALRARRLSGRFANAAMPTIDPRTIRMIIGRIVEGHTLQVLANIEAPRNGQALSRERVRQILTVVDRIDLAAVRSSLKKYLVTTHESMIKERFRDGETLAVIVRSPAFREFGFKPPELIEEINRLVITTRDRSIHGVNAAAANPAQTRRAVREQWGRLEITDGLRRISSQACQGNPPTTTTYERCRISEQTADGHYTLPSIPLITNRFGSWNRALIASGFNIEDSGPRSDRDWTLESCIEHMKRLVIELEELPSVDRYEFIAQARPNFPDPTSLPSATTARNRFNQIGLPRWEAIRSFLVQRLLDEGVW